MFKNHLENVLEIIIKMLPLLFKSHCPAFSSVLHLHRLEQVLTAFYRLQDLLKIGYCRIAYADEKI